MSTIKKTLIHFLTALLLYSHGIAADTPANSLPRYPFQVTCFNGKLDKSSSCTVSCPQPESAEKGGLSCGVPNQVSKLEWSFIERRGDKDVYQISRRFPSDSPTASTISKNIEFHNSRIIVFEDEFQVIVMDPFKK